MSTFCLDCVVYNTNGSLLENLTAARASAPTAGLSSAMSSVHFYSLPSVLTFGFVFSLFNAVCLAKSCRTSADCLLAVLATYSTLSTALAAGLHLPSYSTTFSWYPHAVPALGGLHDWSGAAYAWTLVVLSAERRLTVRRARRQSYCGRVQAGLAGLMVAMVALVASLPQLWMKEAAAGLEPIGPGGANVTLVRIRTSRAGMRPEYAVLYQCFRDLAAVLIPAPLLAVLLCQLLCCGNELNQQHRQLMKTSGACASGVRLEQLRRQVQASRLVATLTLSHLALCWPMLCLLLLWGHRPHWLGAETFQPLYQLFGLLYYLYYPLAFLLHACFLPDYRGKMRRLFCSESCHYTTYVVD